MSVLRRDLDAPYEECNWGTFAQTISDTDDLQMAHNLGEMKMKNTCQAYARSTGTLAERSLRRHGGCARDGVAGARGPAKTGEKQ